MKRTLRKFFILVTVLSMVVTFPNARGQEARARLGGRITDAQGGVVPKAEVVVTSDDTGVSQRTVTNEQGNWVVQFLAPGRYHFTVSTAGFKKVDREGITLQASDTKTIDVQLELGATSQSVEVTAEAPLIDTSERRKITSV